MAEPITIAQLMDASEDAQTLSLFANADAATQVPRRLADPIETLEYWRNYMSALAVGKDGATGPIGPKGLDGSFTQKSYTTYALMDADKVNIPANTSVTVANDTDATKNGMYAYNGTVFTKSAYDPLTQSVSYTDNLIYTALNEDKVLQKVRETPMTPLAPILTGGAAITVVYADAVNYTGEIQTLYAGLKTGTTTIKIKVFDLVGSNFVESKSQSIIVDASLTIHKIDSPILVKKGQYLGFYSTAEAVRTTTSTNQPTAYIKAGDATTIPNSPEEKRYTWQLYFEIKSQKIVPRLNEVSSEIVINSSNIAKVDSFLGALKQDLFYGANEVSATGIRSSQLRWLLAKPLNTTETITNVSFYLLAAAKVGFFIARKINSTTYTLVQETPLYTLPSGINNINLADIGVSMTGIEGDLIGWYSDYNQLAIVTGAVPLEKAIYLPTKNGSELTLGQVYQTSQPQIKFTTSSAKKPLRIELITQANYDALAVKDDATLYSVV